MMTHSLFKHFLVCSLLIIAAPNFASVLLAQDEVEAPQKTIPLEPKSGPKLELEQQLNLKLNELSLVIETKTQELRALKAKFKSSSGNTKLENEVLLATQQLEILNKSFEQLAIGHINLDTINSSGPELTWQQELTLAVKPLLENLRGLTEQPRKRENLRQAIASHRTTALKARQALKSIEELLENSPSASQKKQLLSIQGKWLRLEENAEREQQLARYQMQSLSGADSHWLLDLKESTTSFFKQRGLTIALAILVSIAIWLLLAGLRKLIDSTGSAKTKHTRRTTYRIVAYAQRLLTITLIVVGILVVFFIRGDILLLIITLALLFAGALGLKNLLPQFVSESRLLLNIGGVRENEQVVIDGVPWRVATINVYSKFTNPEIQGILRLPISDLKDMTSRPIKDEKWFPSSIGDWVVDSEDRLYEVIKQTPVSVELQSAQGTNKLLPTSSYFAAGFVNLTKSKQIRITSTFGVGYELQNIALDEVPEVLKKAVSDHLMVASLDTEDIDVRVEFAKANDSSLDYLVIANIGSVASKYYYRIERVIQQACVDACNKQGWSIPFPQLTVHHFPTNIS